jgi:sulfate/thiosulfate-binding protein
MRHLLLSLALLAVTVAPAAALVELLNVSYDPTRELYRAINADFVKRYKAQTGTDVDIRMSHSGSSAQARAVADGLQADVVTLALEPDVSAIAKAGLMPADWTSKLPNGSVPYTSTIVFVVRKGNPKNIHDWKDLTRPDVQIITPNPKTSGNGKLSFLAAWGSVVTNGGSEQDATDFVTKLYKAVPVLDIGARGSTVTFVQRNLGDVHLTWENEAYLEVQEAGGNVEIVYPTTSILARPPVAVVEQYAKEKDTLTVATAYLHYLYTPEAQEIIASNKYRPTDAGVLAKHAADFPAIKLFEITAIAKGWDDAQAKFFADGGVFDAIYKPAPK